MMLRAPSKILASTPNPETVSAVLTPVRDRGENYGFELDSPKSTNLVR
jgi:hypothetical protein